MTIRPLLFLAFAVLPGLALAQNMSVTTTTTAAPVVAPTAPAAPPVVAKPFVYTPDKFDVVTGPSKAPVTIVEYASLSCQHCAHFYKETYPEIQKRYIDSGKVRFILREFPLNKPALSGAKLVACAPASEREKFLKVLFAMQDKWVADVDWNGALGNIAGMGGVDRQKYDACQKDKSLEAQVLSPSLIAGRNNWVSSTPTFFINGKKLEGAQPIDVFVKEIDAVLAAKKTKP